MEAKVVCLLNPDLLEAPGFGEFLDPECCVWVRQDTFFKLSHNGPSEIEALAYCRIVQTFGDCSLKPSDRFHDIFKIYF